MPDTPIGERAVSDDGRPSAADQVDPAPTGGMGDPVAAAPPAAGGGKREAPQGQPRRRGGFLAELPVLVLVAFLLALLMKTFLVQAFYIPSSSMAPTLLDDDRVLVNKLAHVIRDPRRGEVVVFRERGNIPEPTAEVGPLQRFVRSIGIGLGIVPPTEKDFIKRIIGLPGETIEMRGGVVHVDGQPIPEAPTEEDGYLSTRDLSDFGPVTVPEGEYFMMGDNRPHSADSRTLLGTIPEENIVGRAFVTIWPFGRFGRLPIAGYDSGAAAASERDGPRYGAPLPEMSGSPAPLALAS